MAHSQGFFLAFDSISSGMSAPQVQQRMTGYRSSLDPTSLPGGKGSVTYHRGRSYPDYNSERAIVEFENGRVTGTKLLPD